MERSLVAWGWVSVGVALAAWVGVAFAALALRSATSDRAASLSTSMSTRRKEMDAIRLHALFQDTSEKRARLLELLRADPISVAGSIANAALSAHVAARVSDAVSERAQKQVNAAAPPLTTLSFTVEAQGGFRPLVGFVALLESLPYVSSIESFDLQKAPADSGGQWRLEARVRVLTTSPVSS